MAARWNNGWFDVRPRYSAGSPAMVDMRIALQVAYDESRMIKAYLEGAMGPEDKATAELLGLRGIVEWKVEAGVSSGCRPGGFLSYDLLTHSWHLYNPTKLEGVYERGDRLRYTRPAGYNMAPQKVRVEAVGRKRFNVWKEDGHKDAEHEHTLPLMWNVPESEVRDFLSWGVYRKDAPEMVAHTNREIAQRLNEALEDAGVKI